MRVAVMAATLLVSGCATSADLASANLDNGLNALVGQPVEVAVAMLGEPTGKAPMGADTVYGWSQAFTSVAVATYENTTQRTPIDNTCQVKVIAGADGFIKDWHYEGNVRGCRAYSDRLAGVSIADAR